MNRCLVYALQGLTQPVAEKGTEVVKVNLQRATRHRPCECYFTQGTTVFPRQRDVQSPEVRRILFARRCVRVISRYEQR